MDNVVYTEMKSECLLTAVVAEFLGLIGPAPNTVEPFELLMFRIEELVLQKRIDSFQFTKCSIAQLCNYLFHYSKY